MYKILLFLLSSLKYYFLQYNKSYFRHQKVTSSSTLKYTKPGPENNVNQYFFVQNLYLTH